jgi:alpha-tubulin suppressor-like RCC1 family protein
MMRAIFSGYRRASTRARSLFVSLLCLLISACGGGDDPPATPAPTEGSATVTAIGGTVTGPDGVSLSIPAQALDASTTVRIARDSSGAPELLGMSLASPIYAVTPHGTSFTTNALLKLPFDANKIPSGATPVVLRGEPDGTWHVQPLVSTQPGIAAVDVSDLSWFAVGACTPGDAGVFGFGVGDCPANSTLKLEYRDGAGRDIPVSRDADGRALPFPEITSPTNVTVRLLWERPAGVNRDDTLSLNGGLGWLLKGEVVNQQVYSREFQVHLDPAAFPGAGRGTGVVARVFASAQYCRNVPVFGVGNRDVCWSFDTDIAFRVRDTNPAPDAPVITEQPADAAIFNGQRVTYRVSATAPNPLYTQWQRFNPTSGKWQVAKLVSGSGSGDLLIGASPGNAGSAPGTAAGPAVSLSVDNSTPGNPSSIVNGTQSFWLVPDASDAGAQFRVLVCDGFVSGNRTCVYSNAARLDVGLDGGPPWWTLEPADTSVQAGTTASFTVTAHGYFQEPTVAIHVKTPAGKESVKTCLYTTGSNLATSCTFTTGPLATADSGSTVWAEAWNDQAKTSYATSGTAKLTVGSAAAAPSISSQPVAVKTTLGGTANFSVGAGGTAPLSYQWRFNGTPVTDHPAGSGTSGVSGSGSATLSLSNVQNADVGNYSVVVSNGTAPNATSGDAALAIGQSSQVKAVSVAAGDGHTCVVDSNALVECWGANWKGQLGDGTTTDRTVPTRVPNLTGVISLTAGGQHTCALKSDKTVVCWGSNGANQLGIGTRNDSLSPAPVLNLSDVVALAAGAAHTCALKTDGTVACWGSNSHGQLGDGSSGNSAMTPVAVTNLTGVIALHVGYSHTCAAKSDGTAYCWGANDYGELGNNSTVDSASPTAVFSETAVAGFVLRGVTALGGGRDHTCAVEHSNTVVCWGTNGAGQLGHNDTVDSPFPRPVFDINRVAFVAAGGTSIHTCVVTLDQTVKCWGSNAGGQLGDGASSDLSYPIELGLTGVVALATGSSHTCAVKSDGTVYCWGIGTSGQVGGGILQNPQLTPTLVAF